MTESRTVIGWKFDNSYAQLPELFFSRQLPSPVRSPKPVILNESLAAALGLDARSLQQEEGVAVLAGKLVPPGAEPLAQAYAGHQFGYFTMLGDGRAVLLGEHLDPHGVRFDIQLKGSGRTPYSRGGDGRAALGPMLREYIISEAMYALGIPTTRSLAVVATGETVLRENPEIGAVLTRVASSHLRVGTFQYAAEWGSHEDLQRLADYTLQRHFPDAARRENRYLSLLREVIRHQASLIAKWMQVGFIHGVMNTDNMAISGETIDYGPCAFMDTYDPETVFSSIDTNGRYAYGNQPQIAAWNLARFAETLLPLLHENEEKAVELANEALSGFFTDYRSDWLRGMRSKLGIMKEDPGDESVVEELLRIMHKYRADYTNTFLALTFDRKPDTELFHSDEYAVWEREWMDRISKQQETREGRHRLMQKSNPAVIPRNHRVEEALQAAVQGDLSVMERLLSVLARPYAHSPEQDEYAQLPPPTSCRYQTFCGT